jgi:diguanylate cyclase (GGDEF)-like protein
MSQKKVTSIRRFALGRESLLTRITTKIRRSLELEDILTTTVREIRAFLDGDRVKIYRFQTDGSGEVIAESIKNKRLPSLLGLHFPASDIPPVAREMFIKARQRVIVDVTSGHQIINHLDSPKTGESLPIEDIRYAPVDTCHREYLIAMGVRSSLCIPILHQNQLWGLLISHNIKSRRFSERELTIVQLLVDQLSIAIAQSDLLAHARQQAKDEAVINYISSLLHSPLKSTEIRQTVLEKMVKALQGCSGRLYITSDLNSQSDQLYLSGPQPTASFLELTPFWQKMMGINQEDIPGKLSYKTLERSPLIEQGQEKSEKIIDFNSSALIPHLYIIPDVLKEAQLKLSISAFLSTPIRSILIIPLQHHQQCVGCISIFRSLLETEKLWAGEPQQDGRNDLPRQSFAAWREVKKEQAKEWTTEEIKLAKSLGSHLYMAVMQRRIETMILHQASHDQLTGLANRLLFSERLSLSLASSHQQAEMIAVVCLDLTGFKNINDTLGHAVGDQLLKSVAMRLKSCLRPNDIISRWGGDEFMLLFSPILSTEDAIQSAEKILDSLGTPFLLKDQELYIKASLGIAIAPYDGEDAETLLKNADAAMYLAKQQGRNNYQLYTPSIGSQALERMILENHLYKALEKQEFLLYYQPQINLITGELVGMEALIRWRHPERGLVPPNQFIPLAEETGLIAPMGEWVLRTACQQNKQWQLAGLPPITIAVNLSMRQFQQNNLVILVRKILEDTQLEPQYLELEITESIAIQDVDLTISVLRHLQTMGLHISMDDFGMGYSSLSALKHLPLDSLKIDQTFVRDLKNNAQDTAIVQVILALGKGLDLKVIAEGVETREQSDFLRSLDCKFAQGYFFSKPLPVEEVTQLYQNWDTIKQKWIQS